MMIVEEAHNKLFLFFYSQLLVCILAIIYTQI
jgi:hypothetical protein